MDAVHRLPTARPRAPAGRARGFARFAAAVLVAGLAASVASMAAPAAATASGEPETVLVTGEQPGPGIWRISNGEHALWILGTLEPLPKQMVWRSRQVEAVIGESQEVLAPPGAGVSIGFFKGLGALPAALRARKNADGQTLREVLPADLYVRWVALRDRYLGSGTDAEHLRPSVAAHRLYERALDRSGLSSGDGIWKQVESAARHARVPVTPVTLQIRLDDPKQTIRQLAQIPREADVACLARTLERLENDLPAMRERASRWSLGDLDELRALPYADQGAACFDAVASVPALRERVLQLREQLADQWVGAAQAALARNPSSFAVLPMSELLKPDGWLARLRASGYTVDEP